MKTIEQLETENVQLRRDVERLEDRLREMYQRRDEDFRQLREYREREVAQLHARIEHLMSLLSKPLSTWLPDCFTICVTPASLEALDG